MEGTENTIFMCVTKKVINKLCKVYPKSRSVVQKRALERRFEIMKIYTKMQKIQEEKRQ